MLPGCLDQPRTTVYCLVADRNVYLSRYSLLTCFLLQAFNRWGYYPLILIGSWAFATINRVHDFANPGHKIFWLSILDVGFAGLMGLFNSIAYGLNSSVRRAIAERLDMYLPERFKRSLPTLTRFKSQQENELTSLIVDASNT
jgi:hypothetical protein